MKLTLLSTLLLGLAIGGCTTMSPEERRAQDEATCRSYGFTKRNDAFAECLQRLDLDRRASRRASAAQASFSTPLVIYQPVPVRVKG